MVDALTNLNPTLAHSKENAAASRTVVLVLQSLAIGHSFITISSSPYSSLHQKSCQEQAELTLLIFEIWVLWLVPITLIAPDPPRIKLLSENSSGKFCGILHYWMALLLTYGVLLRGASCTNDRLLGPRLKELPRPFSPRGIFNVLCSSGYLLFAHASFCANHMLSLSTGRFKYPNMIPTKDFTLDNLVPFLDGKDKQLYVSLASRMLRWLPQEGATAKKLARSVLDPCFCFAWYNISHYQAMLVRK
jgi:hypothetical protein